MNTIQKRRFQKLIDFLKELPRKRFDFGDLGRQEKCGTVACALGWTPKLFPHLVEWRNNNGWIVLKGSSSDYSEFDDITLKLFGLKIGDLFDPGSAHYINDTLPDLREDATPKQVAKMLEKFLRLYEGGKIKWLV